jgi:aminoglycoside phosphotransferase (APT) family kinase protein
MKAPDDQSAIEELADMLELIHSITAIHSSTMKKESSPPTSLTARWTTSAIT